MFEDCTSLRNITIPKSVTTIGWRPFIGCTRLLFINVSKDNEYFSNLNGDGILYDKNITQLISYPAGLPNETLEIAPTITSIATSGIRSCYNILYMVIPNSVVVLNDFALYLNSNMETV